MCQYPGDEDDYSDESMEEEPKGWYVGLCKCRICEYTQVSVFPSEADEDNLECKNCGHPTSECVKYFPPPKPGELINTSELDELCPNWREQIEDL